MSTIHVCPLSKLPETVRLTGARSLVTFINQGTPVHRPREIAAEQHLFVPMSDITTAVEGHILPNESHVTALLGFVQKWDRSAPLLIHCWAGVSRSTAAAFITACALYPGKDEQEIAAVLRRNSPTATPNALLIDIADTMLGREGKMRTAIDAIGRGSECFEGTPFKLDL
ncbi:tyrosine phosphatase family protein [Beijerinckia mobilis]|uniref:tyrosine phosphatase family protein n=1 Tax=Beijerinckia mobilis TaxID=231434 RepID=UPI000556BB64|nr:tyrosine phosphatase family protein [Beijerinckia mobilis]